MSLPRMPPKHPDSKDPAAEATGGAGATGGATTKPNPQGATGGATAKPSPQVGPAATPAGSAKQTSQGLGQGGQRPPPGTASPGALPKVSTSSGLVQMSPEALQQIVTAAVAAAIAQPSAVAVAAPAVAAAPPPPKLPKFWEQEPAAWFSVFRDHFEGKQATQLHMFNTLLPLLPTAAVSLCRPLVESRPPDVFTQAEELLLHHYQLGPMERGKLIVQCTSLGDRTPITMLAYLRSLQPSEPEGVVFRYIFVNLLPDVVREVVSSMDSLDEMAKTANNILQASASSKITSVAVDDPVVAAVRRPSRPPPPLRRRDVCRLHQRYGRDAFRCDKPDTCSMRNVIRTTPLPPKTSGNAPAGGQ